MAEPLGEPDVPVSASESPRTPRWVWLTGVIVGVVVLVIVVLMLLPGGGHGPGRHAAVVNDSPEPITRRMSAERVLVTSAPPSARPAEAIRTIEVVAFDTRTSGPSSTTVTAGEAVTFRGINSGLTVRDSTFGDTAMQR